MGNCLVPVRRYQGRKLIGKRVLFPGQGPRGYPKRSWVYAEDLQRKGIIVHKAGELYYYVLRKGSIYVYVNKFGVITSAEVDNVKC